MKITHFFCRNIAIIEYVDISAIEYADIAIFTNCPPNSRPLQPFALSYNWFRFAGIFMNNETIIASARRTILSQAASISALDDLVTDDFAQTIAGIASSKGRLVVSGIGKSAIVAQKIVATLNSTGTPALFMHAADAIHGDLGMITSDDIVMIISKSGDSPEIKVLLPLVKGFGNQVIGMVGNLSSYLATHADRVINTTVQQESCPNNLAPTNSTTAQMVMGDALAVCLMEMKNFKTEDFARFHPGGALGKKLYLRVSDLVAANKPQVNKNQSVKEVIMAITLNRLGATAVMDEQNRVIGIVTDGDIRRMLEKNDTIGSLTAADIMCSSPKQINTNALAAEALEIMRHHNINQLLVMNDHSYIGIIHLQDLIREGII